MTTKSSAKSSPRARSTSSSSAKPRAKASAKPATKSRASHTSHASHAAKTTRASTHRSSHAAKPAVHVLRTHPAIQPQPPAPSDIPTALTDPQSFERQPEPVEAMRATGITEDMKRTPHEVLTDSIAQSVPQRLDELRALPGQVRDLVVERVNEVRSQISEKIDAIRAWPKHAVQTVIERAGEITGLRRVLAPSAAE